MLAFLSPFSRTSVNKVPQVVNMATPPPSAAHSPAPSFGGDGGGGPGASNGVLNGMPNGVHMQNGVSRTTTGNEDHDRLLNAPPWNADQEKIILDPYVYLSKHPGKDIRTLLMQAFNVWLQVPEESLAVINKVVGMLHTASLLVDDVEDNSILRRGVPVAHKIFGVAQTINCANYVYFLALQQLSELGNPALITIYTEELLNLHRGQGMDLYWRDLLTLPTEQEYLDMVSNKTGGLFRLAIKLMMAESKTGLNLVPLVNLIGLTYQIRDDFMNLQSSTYTKNKGFCEDLTEGKFSFPIIHSIRSDPSNKQILNILKQQTKDEDVKLYAVKYMQEVTGTFEYTKKRIEEFGREAMEMVQSLGGNEKLEAILARMFVE
ncbi:geranylgeranyl diphosphate synthase [Peziza echinospora]|nr:geranylgeranyl diphosphate synthase [Peziza echinospora]